MHGPKRLLAGLLASAGFLMLSVNPESVSILRLWLSVSAGAAMLCCALLLAAYVQYTSRIQKKRRRTVIKERVKADAG